LKSLLEKYKSNRVIRALVQLVPLGIGGAVDVVLCETLEKIRRDRAMTFFDELAAGDVILNENLLKSEDFLHAFFSTAKFALNSRRREKIRMFASLLKSSLTNMELKNIDEYEDYLHILDELSYREILALSILDRFSNRPRKKEWNDLQWLNTFWGEFEEALTKEIDIPKGQISDYMNRIARTGCYEILNVAIWGYKGGKGKLTPTYQKLKKYILKESLN